MRRTTLSLILSLISAPAFAETPARAELLRGAPVTWGELITPDRLVENLARSALTTLRSFVDVTYRTMETDLRGGTLTLRDVKAYPLIGAIDYAPCDIEIRRVALAGSGFINPDDLDLTVTADDLRITSSCFAAPLGEALQDNGITTLRLPRAMIGLSYDVPSAAATLTGHAIVESLAEVSVDIDFDYLWYDATQPDFYPVIFLEAASVALRNEGLWDVLLPAIGPEMTDAVDGPATLQITAAGALVEAGASPAFATDLSAELAATWSGFLADPQVLAFALTPDEPIFIDIDTLDEAPGSVLEELAPRVASEPLARVAPVPAALLATALEAPDNLTPAERLRVGRQLLEGRGAPRDVSSGLALLLPLVEAGQTDALGLVGALHPEALHASDYAALSRAAMGDPDIAALLDGLEAEMGLAATLDLQGPLPDSFDFDGIESATDLRARALARLGGREVPRSLAQAAYWASLATAAGDRISARIFDDVRRRATTRADERAWDRLQTAIAARALKDWIREDLPARLTGP